MPSQMQPEEVAIVGAGPAGLAAAIQLKRQGIDPAIFERDSIGGVLRNANRIENYPGFPDGLSGLDFVRQLERQAKLNALRITFEEVAELDYGDGMFLVKTRTGEYASQMVVVASGTKSRRFSDLNIPTGAMDHVVYEIHGCLQESGKVFAVVGSGDAAFDYALNLARNNRVFLLNRGAVAKCIPLLLERVRMHPRIAYLENTVVSNVELTVQGELHIECLDSKGTSILLVHYVVGAIGRDPQVDFLSQRVRKLAGKLEDEGYLYFVGDVRHGEFRQTAIAVGDGVLAAMSILKQRKGTS